MLLESLPSAQTKSSVVWYIDQRMKNGISLPSVSVPVPVCKSIIVCSRLEPV